MFASQQCEGRTHNCLAEVIWKLSIDLFEVFAETIQQAAECHSVKESQRGTECRAKYDYRSTLQLHSSSIALLTYSGTFWYWLGALQCRE